MKNRAVLLALTLVALASSALAEDKVPATISYSIQIMESGKLINSFTMSTVDEVMGTVFVGKETAYVAACTENDKKIFEPVVRYIKTGLEIRVTPTVQKNGQIKTVFALGKTDLGSPLPKKGCNDPGAKQASPAINKLDLSQSFVLSNGEEISIALGAPASSVKITVTKEDNWGRSEKKSSADDVRILSEAEQFNCSSFPAPKLIRSQPDGTTVTCSVMGDVYSFFTKNLVIPAASTLYGKTKGGHVEWRGWTTPTGDHVTGLQGALISPVSKEGEEFLLHVAVLKDIKVQY